MKVKQIIFPRVNCAELIEKEVKMGENSVCVKTAFSTVSCGTERANITGCDSIAGSAPPSVFFPRACGYCCSGVVEAVGENVKSVKVGDRVAVYNSFHQSYQVVPEEHVIKIEYEGVSLEEAALAFIATFPMAAIRKTRLEMGEAALVMGGGILGQIAVRLLRLAGAAPIIAADLVADRREAALRGGADYALDPADPDFAKEVKRLSGGGVPVCIEVTGVGKGLDQALDCMAKFGRVALLGCTRDPNFTIDYYRKVHAPGVSLIGAHTNARPDVESYPGYFTHRDDIKAYLRLCALGRLDTKSMIAETYLPEDCVSVYDRLINDRNFPITVQFDWTKEEA